MNDSTEIISEFYNNQFSTISLSCNEYYIDYKIEEKLDFLIKVKNDSTESAINDSIQKISKFKELGADFGFKDEGHIRTIMSTFFNDNKTLNFTENWQCILQDYTTIKAGNTFSQKQINGERRFVLHNINLSLRKPKQIMTFNQIESFVEPVIETLNKSSICTLHTKNSEEFLKLSLISGQDFKLNASLNSTDINQTIKQLLVNKSKIAYRSEEYLDITSVVFRELEFTKKDDRVRVQIEFDEEQQLDNFNRSTSNMYNLRKTEE